MSVGEMLVAIRPDVRGLPADLARGISTAGPSVTTAFGAIGTDAMRRLLSEVQTGVGNVNDALEGAGGTPLVVDVDTQRADAGIATLASELTALRAVDASVQITADATAAQSALAGIATSTETLPDGTVVITADGGAAAGVLANLSSLTTTLPDGTIVVNGDVSAAESALSGVAVTIRSLPDGTVTVTADTSAAEGELEGLADPAGASGRAAGDAAGEGVASGLSGAVELVTAKGGPIIGSIVGIVSLVSSLSIGAQLINAVLEGSEGLAERGMFAARTGLDAETARRFGIAAGESYAQNFGTSISENLDVARSAFENGILGGDATTQEITNVVNGLTTVSDILGEEVPAVARAAGQAVATGLATDVTGALDLIVRAQQKGLNTSEDLLDTVNEYGTSFRAVGLDGEQALGLISQALGGGARDADVAADAIKEFGIITTAQATETSGALDLINVNSKAVFDGIAAGGPEAANALQLVLEGFKNTEDPILRNEAAVKLFGTQAEDLGEALFAMDLSTAREEFGLTAGALEEATSKIGTDPAAALETAKRGIEVSATSIKESIALAFAPQVTGFSEWVSGNRGAITEFAFSYIDAAFDMAIAGAELGSSLLDAGGQVVLSLGGMTDSVLGFFETMLDAAEGALGWVPGFGDDISAAKDNISSLRDSSAEAVTGLATGMSAASIAIDTTLVPTLEGAQSRMNEFGIPAVAQANFADATAAATKGVEAVGIASDGTNVSITNLGGKFDTTSASGKVLDTQLKDATQALKDQVTAGGEAGATADELTASYNSNRDALISQIEQMGFSREEATGIATDYGLIPDLVETTVSQPGMQASRDDVAYYEAELAKLPADAKTKVEAAGAAGSEAAVRALRDEVGRLKDKTIYITSITVQRNQENTTGRAGGGWIPGAPSSVDNVMVAMASGEYVVNAADAQRNAALLEAINAGQDVNALLSRTTTAQARTETVAVGGGLSAADRDLLAALASRPAVLQIGSHQFALAVADAEREKVRVGRR